jgi:quinol monooxygenase YgiN
MSDTSAFVVVDLWRAKAGKRDQLEATLADSARVFRAQPGVLSVDYTHLDGDPDRYLVVFRYASQAARDAFRATDALRGTMERLAPLWDLESDVMLGHQSGL